MIRIAGRAGRMLAALFFALAACGALSGLQAQTRVRTETIRPPAAPAPDARTAAKVDPKAADGAMPEIIADLARLPAPVAATRERILTAARTGDLGKLMAVMKDNGMPVFSLSDHRDPAAFWKANYPDSEGVEALAILISILEAPFVHVEKGTPQEVYVWPYFARMPLKALTPQQRVELFRIVTGADYKEMQDFGAYSFYRLGIGPDGTWHYFVSGD
ncbi:MAG: hypothetical protein GHHEDOFH_00733 [Pseudorhodoplanes sp.]|nr:hypothetical protein [Pseudorhodoplanes sp.]GIK80090.1 MAG: hypothetical protein BroJett024_11950 [Alphaproteobacteria bacterium]